MPTALLSVYDKSGIVDLARGLDEASWRILSSGGTARAIAEAGIPVVDVADVTGLPAILDHRVVTLHPRVHGGLLADPTDPSHLADMAVHGIEPIDLVVVNLYPFTSSPGIETIDIGGPAMVRAAAKNHAHVGVVVDPRDYGVVLDEIRTEGSLSVDTRRRLARDAFAAIAAYDADSAVSVKHLATHPDCTGAVGVMGFCIGGHLAYRAALNKGVRAAACFYATDLHKHTLGAGMNDDSLARAGELLCKCGICEKHRSYIVNTLFGLPYKISVCVPVCV